jgi:hypothetical protein
MLTPPPIYPTHYPMPITMGNPMYYTPTPGFVYPSLASYSQCSLLPNHEECIVGNTADKAKVSCDKENIPAPSKSSQRRDGKGRFAPHDALTTRILSTWLERNQHHPYPTAETIAVLAKISSLQPEQVRKWFSNRRLRSKKVKRLEKKSIRL